MSISYIPQRDIAFSRTPKKRRVFPKGYFFGLAMAALMWAALGFGTTMSLSPTPVMETVQAAAFR